MSGGRAVRITWRGRPAEAWLPDRLDQRDLDLTSATARRTEQAAAAVLRSDDGLPAHWEPLARLLLRSEGIASSNIEGLRAPVEEVAAAELDPAAVPDASAWIADNLAAVLDALDEARHSPLGIDALHRWHSRLMQHAALPPAMVATFRTAQSWVGGLSPHDAAFVPPPPDDVPALMDDLVAFVNGDDVDPVTCAAVAHAQFETVHPYADGNGRIGRILVGWILVRRLHVHVPPPVSVLLARDIGGYLSGLTRFRTEAAEPWVAWFARTVQRAADATAALVGDVQDLVVDWTRALEDVRADATARRVVELLPAHPVLSAPLVAQELAVSDEAARGALALLGVRGVLESTSVRVSARGRPPKVWLARPLLDRIAAWSGGGVA